MTQDNKFISSHDWSETALAVLESASNIIAERFSSKDAYCDPLVTKEFLKFKLSSYDREVFSVMFLNAQNELIEYKEMFFGTINTSAVYPREVVKYALRVNASAVIFAHNHPSGTTKPSESDKQITQRLKDALELVDIRVLDHIIVGKTQYSFAEGGLL